MAAVAPVRWSARFRLGYDSEVAGGIDLTRRIATLLRRVLPELDAAFLVTLSEILLLGAALRVSFVLGTDFPLNDGGMFYGMVRDLQQSSYSLPDYITYNSANIPFAYPLLPFYLAGAAADWTGLSLIQVFQWLPVAANTLTIIAFCFLCGSTVKSRTIVVYAALVFVLLPRSFQWLIMGGGLTRSIGILFAILAIHQIYLMLTRRERRFVVLAAIFAGLAALSHLEAALFVALSAVVFLIARGRSRRGLTRFLAVALGAVVVSAPWWAVVISRHGLAPFLAAGSSGEPPFVGLLYVLTNVSIEPMFPVMAALALLGMLLCVRDKQYLLPVWLVVLFLFDPRKALTTATVPLAMLAGIGIVGGLIPLLTRERRNQASDDRSGEQLVRRGYWPEQRLAQVVVCLIVVYCAVAAFIGYRSLLAPLSASEREAMQWVSGNTPDASTFLVMTGDAWASDKSSEWFPLLSERRSVATVQGYEWTKEYRTKIENYKDVQKCVYRGSDCLNEWTSDTGTSFTHVYLTKRYTATSGNTVAGGVSNEDPCWSLRHDLAKSPDYLEVYDGPGATVYAKVAGQIVAEP